MWFVPSNLPLLILVVLLAFVLLDDVAIATAASAAPDSIPPYHSSGEPLAPGQDMHGGVPMGVSNEQCDDGKTNLTLDWDGSHSDFVCPSERWGSNKIAPTPASIIEQCTDKLDSPIHVCMHRSIVYNDVIPTSGAHRPLWARYGEYRYLPKQRWLHNLEHGAAVFLYHPCADEREVTRLRRIAKGCLRKHIITPYKELTRELPFAVLTYGCKLQLPHIVSSRIRSFLKAHANRSPERRVGEDGQFSAQLIHPAQTVSNVNDCAICPTEPFEGCHAHNSKTNKVRQTVNKANHHQKTDKPRKKHHRIHD